MSAREIYETSIRLLSPIERLRLASIILDELTHASGAGLDLRDEWDEQDIADLTGFSARHAEQSIGTEESDA